MTYLAAIAAVIVALAAMWFGGRKSGITDTKRETALEAEERYAKTTKDIADADLGIGANDADRIKRLREFADK